MDATSHQPTAYCPRCAALVDLIDEGQTCGRCRLVLPATTTTTITERPTTASVHITVPAPIKARWVRDSRAAGQRLTDWLIARIEREP